MGKTSGNPRQNMRNRPKWDDHPSIIVPKIMSFYELDHERKLDELIDLLHSYSCRDQPQEDVIELPLLNPGDGPATVVLGPGDRRLEGYRIAKELKKDAVAALALIERIRGNLGDFDAVVNSHPGLMQNIFETDLGPPDQMFYPPELIVLQHFYEMIGYEKPINGLSTLAALPIRPKLPGGPVANMALRAAIAACRDYWLGVEGKPWSMNALKNADVRQKDDPNLLAGPCEAFVVDALRACGLRCRLADVATAWTEIDKQARGNGGEVPGRENRQLMAYKD
ncbi:hypothetical protein [uncultured Sphingobium sp.]|uniref:hypothetical protein n=1 Tax=uncultured Sphingobium sp. TaxID=316087 RepID=UPI00262F59E6|nr:hypothetical protein [uncultured Sphingobium sp.]